MSIQRMGTNCGRCGGGGGGLGSEQYWIYLNHYANKYPITVSQV